MNPALRFGIGEPDRESAMGRSIESVSVRWAGKGDNRDMPMSMLMSKVEVPVCVVAVR